MSGSRWLLGAWVSDGIGWGAHVSLRGPRRCLALIYPFQGKLGVPCGLQPEGVRGSCEQGVSAAEPTR